MKSFNSPPPTPPKTEGQKKFHSHSAPSSLIFMITAIKPPFCSTHIAVGRKKVCEHRNSHAPNDKLSCTFWCEAKALVHCCMLDNYQVCRRLVISGLTLNKRRNSKHLPLSTIAQRLGLCEKLWEWESVKQK